jgi:hypothetical protein
LTIIAAAIGATLRNTSDITPKNMKIEVVKIEVLNVVNVRRNVLMRRNQILIITQNPGIRYRALPVIMLKI